MADFVVGGGPPDAYMFDLSGDLASGAVRLHLPGLFHRRSIPLASWVEFRHQRLVWMLAKTSSRASEGHLQVHVRQRSSGREAIVEFGFGT